MIATRIAAPKPTVIQQTVESRSQPSPMRPTVSVVIPSNPTLAAKSFEYSVEDHTKFLNQTLACMIKHCADIHRHSTLIDDITRHVSEEIEKITSPRLFSKKRNPVDVASEISSYLEWAGSSCLTPAIDSLSILRDLITDSSNELTTRQDHIWKLSEKLPVDALLALCQSTKVQLESTGESVRGMIDELTNFRDVKIPAVNIGLLQVALSPPSAQTSTLVHTLKGL
jgi:hypothetical protein